MGEEKDVPESLKKIYELLKNEMTADEVAKIVKKDISEINSMLTIMEIEELIEQLPGGRYRIAGKGAK